jgi:hypothetical protein
VFAINRWHGPVGNNPQISPITPLWNGTAPPAVCPRLREFGEIARVFWQRDHPNENPSAVALDRLCVNHLRHERTNYDRELDRFLGKLDNATQAKCHAALKGFVLDKIAAAYPWLEKECLRQKAELSP